ncbi:flagellar motor switch protein FliG [Falsiphaeobacter marinintestinus]|uniref:flagellar motor switch protein FliG n=1 Tax=Falsiphaeobacter marinintestinus TaxID=1492905 RepID=UPI0011B51BBB|nr:FliG C-terminal domain-containing protein [Phaeobacter marinintestinus]
MKDDGTLARLPLSADAERGTPPIGDVRVPRDLEGSAKAAIMVRLLLNEGADIPLEMLPDDLQALLTQQMGSMGLVDRVTLDAVVLEFAEALGSVGLSFTGGLAGALSTLDGKISPQTAARLRKEAGVRQAGDPWIRLRALPPDELAEFAQAESIEVAAVLLSKLDTGKAAALLGLLPGPLARKIAYAVSQTGAVTPEAVDRIGLSLAGQLDQRPIPAFTAAPSERVGAILNQSSADTRDDVLTALDEEDQVFATSVRKSIFIFSHIADRVAKQDVPKILREADPGDVVTALAFATDGVNAATAQFILENLSSRMADNLREEIGERGKVRKRDGEAAMSAIVAAIRALELAGDLTLIVPEDPEED